MQPSGTQAEHSSALFNFQNCPDGLYPVMGKGQNQDHHTSEVLGQPRKWGPSLPVLFHWLELSHVALPNCKGN